MGRTHSYRALGLKAGEAEYFGPGGWTPLRAESAVTFYPPLSPSLRRSSVDRLSRSEQSISYEVGPGGWNSAGLHDGPSHYLRNEDQAHRGCLVGPSVSLRTALHVSLSFLADRVLRGVSLVRSFSAVARGVSPLARSLAAASWRNRRSHLDCALKERAGEGRDEPFSRSIFPRF